MYYYRIIISYNGTHYCGWQDLGKNSDVPTIQAQIQRVLQKICKYQECTVSVASRTDAGVHAQGQVAKITIALSIEEEKLLLGMNSLLADDIRILQCEVCSSEFNANKHSTSKEYHYYFSTQTIHNPVMHDVVAHIPSLSKGLSLLDIKCIKEACKLFVGEHDFYNFAKRDKTMHSTVRRLISCEIVEVQDSVFSKKVYYIKVVGNGFLRYMVRYIAGALFGVGRKEISLSDIANALANKQEQKISRIAKARGLHLIKIFY
ncbi:MAG: tRNA pseudouridine(38-40) synthase TruA [Sulfurimonas sp.]|nr:tRNA pseudouridine(38-40) synthase TruA [Sulfurimonas sp.]MDQ7062217.1 tRNA pseudouridine(38-40) synthase TruA [Sulfurimonas sp.]